MTLGTPKCLHLYSPMPRLTVQVARILRAMKITFSDAPLLKINQRWHYRHTTSDTNVHDCPEFQRIPADKIFWITMFAIVKSSPLKLLRLQAPETSACSFTSFASQVRTLHASWIPGPRVSTVAPGWGHQTSSNLMLMFNGEIHGLGATKNMKNHPIICIIWHSLVDLECVQLWWWIVQLASLSNPV
jgi:hypothetical protein